ncbi:MAG: isochorismate synthase [Chloroflexota bacterium]|nr:isochorismate synthase [Chloroflexota bacterium]
MSVLVGDLVLSMDRLFERLRAGVRNADICGRLVLVSVTQRVPATDPLRFYAGWSDPHVHRAYWERPDTGHSLVGIGAVRTLQSPGAHQASDLACRWEELLEDAVLDAGGAWGTGPVLLGGFAFDPGTPRTANWENFPAGMFVLPRYSLAHSFDGAWLTINAIVAPGDEPEQLGLTLASEFDATWTAIQAMAPLSNDSPCTAVVVRDGGSAAAWKGAVARVAQEVRAGAVEKVVLARAVCADANEPIPVAPTLDRLRQAYPHCTVFAVAAGGATFLGATPERLVSLKGREVRVSSIAGSRPRSMDPVEDNRFGEELLGSVKDRDEHEVVTRSLVGTLRKVCSVVHAPPAPVLLQLSNVQHLYTPLTGCAAAGQSVLHLVERLHPTPAVGGAPRVEALRLIREHEGLDRGWYAGPVGWMDIWGQGEFVVAIRSALVHGSEAMLFAGCGIVGGSDPDAEYFESRLKLEPVQRALGVVNA